MAVVKGPAMSMAASGNMGNICYSKWRELTVARSAWSGTVPNTSKQVTIQNRLTSLSQYWGNMLSEDDRSCWGAEARVAAFRNRFGEEVHYSGYVLFMSRNMNYKRWYTGTLIRPVASNGHMQYDGYVMEWSSVQNRFNWQIRYYAMHGLPWPDGHEAWLAGPFDSPGRKATEPEYLFVGYALDPNRLVLSIGSEYGKYYWMGIRLIDNSGVVSPFIYKQVAT